MLAEKPARQVSLDADGNRKKTKPLYIAISAPFITKIRIFWYSNQFPIQFSFIKLGKMVASIASARPVVVVIVVHK